MNWTKELNADLESSWLYRAAWVGALLVGFLSAYAQPDLSRSLPPLPSGYWLELEEVVSHSGGELDGMTTYRLYVNCLGPLDYVSSCSGDDSNPLVLNSTSSPAWFNSPFVSGWNAQNLNPAFFAFSPEVAYDSFLTLGPEDSNAPGGSHPSTIWGEIDATLEFDQDGYGNSLNVNDAQGGAWYTPFPGIENAWSHPAFAGEDLRVLVAQLTTAGEVSGQIQVQIFQNGNQNNEFRSVLPIATEAVEGCLDQTAFNYNPEATSGNPALCNFHCTGGTWFDAATGRCELEAWTGEVGDTFTLDPCHLDFDDSGWMDITDLYRYWVVFGQDPGTPASPCGAGTYATYNGDNELDLCLPAPATNGPGNGLGNLNPRYFDLNGDGVLDTADFLNLLNVFGRECEL
jgi:hypothetical protein